MSRAAPDPSLAPVPSSVRAARVRPNPTLLVAFAALASVAMFGNYYVYDSIAPLADVLHGERGLSDTQIGALNAIYSLPNIAMVLIGGLVIDRIGATRAIVLFALACALGSLACALAGGYRGLVAGRLLFGVGAESLIVGITTALGQWFRHARLGLVLGVNLSIARAGSYAADLSPAWARSLYAGGSRGPLLLAFGFALASLLACVALRWLDARNAAAPAGSADPTGARHERFEWRDLLHFERSYWVLVGLCVAIYSVLLPFRSTFAIKYYQDAHGLSREAAGVLNSWVFLAAIVATPLCGLWFDRAGRRAGALLAGAALLVPVFPLLAWTSAPPWLSNVLLGLSYSCVPAVLWPCVARLVDAQRLGSAYGLMTMIQNVGLTAFNFAAGALNDSYGAGPALAQADVTGASGPEGYRPMLHLFAVLSLASLACAVALFRSRARGVDRDA